MVDSFFKNESQEESTQEIPDLKEDKKEKSSESLETDNFISEEGRIAAILSYLPVLCFIPLLNMRENKEARFHARQGVLLFLIEILAVVFLIDGISHFIFKAILIIAVAFSIVGIYFALKGKNYRLPIIGDIIDKYKL
ncbi:MAG: hypothetical protein GXO93_03995 [FCB group bacterium]|nr:hypothetical protein [FCB group bacterium]